MPLVLRRKQGESVTITVPPSTMPTVIVVRVVDEDHNRMAFIAPPEVTILRSELVNEGGESCP